jgi:hypothetical protein
MDNVKANRGYEAPTVVDYGDLAELTAACLGGHGGDIEAPMGSAGAFSVGASNPAAACSSTP